MVTLHGVSAFAANIVIGENGLVFIGDLVVPWPSIAFHIIHD